MNHSNSGAADSDRSATPTKVYRVRSSRARHLLTFLMVFGPGLIVMEADNDAGAVSTYVEAGAVYGKELLWMMLVLLPATYFIQEMVVRLGIATGQGHAAMIFRRFGKWWGAFSLVDLLIVNFLTLVTEFAAISLALDALGVSKYASVPVAALGLILMVVTGSYCRWERIAIVLCLCDVLWFFMAWAGHPSVLRIVSNTLLPHIPSGPGVPDAGHMTPKLIFLVIAIVGTTIAPWQLFFQQSCVADKRLRFADLKWARLDTFIGACFTVLVAGAMMLVGDIAFRHGLEFKDPAKMAEQLGSTMGKLLSIGLPLMMVNAAMLGTTAISLSSAWAWGEVKGWPHSLQKKFREAPGFYGSYALGVVAAAAIVLIPRFPEQVVILGVQVLAGVMLPSAIIFLQLLLNDKELLGEEFANRPWSNWVNWTIIIILFALSLILAVQVIFPEWFPGA